MIDLTEIRCQEITNTLGDGTPIECGRTSEGSRIVFHQHDGRNVYVMCEACASHNIRNRGGVELIENDALAIAVAEVSQQADDIRRRADAGPALRDLPVKLDELSPREFLRSVVPHQMPLLPCGIGCPACRAAGECNECGRAMGTTHRHEVRDGVRYSTPIGCTNGRCSDCCSTVCEHATGG